MRLSLPRIIKGPKKSALHTKAREVADDAANIADTAAEEELKLARDRFKRFDKDHTWAFMAGQASQDFRGNPKYLFIYINRYRPDINAYWICNSEETVEFVKGCGFVAFLESSSAGQFAMQRTGVIVAEQVKQTIPDGFQNVKYLNVWHGNGFKHVERQLRDGDLALELASKYVKMSSFYRDHQLVIANSEPNEELIRSDLGVDEDKIIRSGYPRCLYQKHFERFSSFNHDLRAEKGLPPSTKLVAYTPTYRAERGGTFSEAIPDLEKLHDACKKNNILFVFKVHPNMEEEVGFLKAWESFGDRPNFWFWDNALDFYEVMDQVDLAILDYSAIFADMVAMGITHYIRYVFDLEDYMIEGFTQGTERYLATTAGRVCKSFDDLLEMIGDYESTDCAEECSALNEQLWGYSNGADDFDNIIVATMDFEVQLRPRKTLYSFDIFDTLFSRKVLDPKGIYYYVQERARDHGGFPFAIERSYPTIRHTAEYNVREYYRKSKDLRQSESVEIHFDEIFDRIRDVHGLTDEQLGLLKSWELEAEYENVIPLPEQISLVKQLLDAGEDVLLISDMYLPEGFIRKQLKKADPALADLPMFLSNNVGVLKTSQLLYKAVYDSFKPYYDYERWVHYGDNAKADRTQPRRFNIIAKRVEKPEFGLLQREMIQFMQSYDAHLVAAIQARMCKQAYSAQERFVINFVSLAMVPYIDWVIRDAESRGYETLYFVSRDGHHLKRIADAVIESRGVEIKTKYIYGSRRVWRVPSFIDEVDQGFWQNYGNFAQVPSKENLFKAMELDEATFRTLFPTIDPDAIDFTEKDEIDGLIKVFKQSQPYLDYLLKVAASKRELSGAYLLQEINPDESFAVVEYWGRGYNQDCMVRLWRNAIGDESASVPFYYSRSILPSNEGSIRHDFTTNNSSQFFVEAIFANMPYKSIENYQVVDGVIEPVIVPIPYDKGLYNAQEFFLPRFAKEYATSGLLHPIDTDRMLYDFLFEFYNNNRDNAELAEQVGSLVDSISLYGRKREFAPPFTKELLEDFREKRLSRSSGLVTTSITMSAVRTPEDVLEEYKEMFQILPGDGLADGRLLSEEEIEKNAEHRDKYYAQLAECTTYRKLYESAVDQLPVSNCIVFVANEKKMTHKTMTTVYKLLIGKGAHVDVVCFGAVSNESEMIDAIVRIASARCIIVDCPIRALAKVDIRPESKLVMLRPDPFNLYNKAHAAKSKLKWRQRYLDLVSNNDVSIMQIPSSFQEERFMRYFASGNTVECTLRGNVNTDIYFNGRDAEYRAALEELFPAAKGKKVLLYVPSIRCRQGSESWAELIDLEMLKRYIGDDYVVVLNCRKKSLEEYDNVFEVDSFCKVITDKELDMRKLLMACDVVVGDYRDRFFESAIVGKPVFSTAIEFERKLGADHNLNCKTVDEYTLGPVVHTAEELAMLLEHLDEYDYSRLEAFAKKYFGDCDGNSAERVASLALEIVSG